MFCSRHDVAHLLAVRTAVGELIDGITLRRIEVGRLDHHRFHDEAVARLHLDELRLREPVLGERVDPVLVEHAHVAAVGPMEPDLRRRRDVAPPVDEEAEARAEIGAVRARRLRQPLEAAAVDPDAVHVAADRAPLGAREIDPAALLVHAVERSQLPPAGGHLFEQRAVGGVVIGVREARPAAQPEKRSVRQPRRRRRVFGVDPVRARFAKQRCRRRRAGGDVDTRLRSSHDCVRFCTSYDQPARGRPGDADDQEVGAGVFRRIDPGDFRRAPAAARTTPSFTVGFGSPALGYCHVSTRGS